MRSGGGRDEARIDPAEDDPQARREDVWDSAQRWTAAERGLQASGPALDDQPVPSPCQRAARRLGDALLAQVEPAFEQSAKPLAGQAKLLVLWPLDAKDLDRLVRAAVAAEIALRFAQGPQPAHCARDYGPPRTVYSYCKASSTFSLAARRAGTMAASTPTTIAATTK
ncbi:MAG: hypothetical protein AUH17_08240 [Actinobacteria bacterium 13_2_20CM_68_14]|nr:MAG: hypothetical protein AUH17_08240 [Actinobacteria bacterium 13_2_20CM_68_14]